VNAHLGGFDRVEGLQRGQDFFRELFQRFLVGGDCPRAEREAYEGCYQGETELPIH